MSLLSLWGQGAFLPTLREHCASLLAADQNLMILHEDGKFFYCLQRFQRYHQVKCELIDSYHQNPFTNPILNSCSFPILKIQSLETEKGFSLSNTVWMQHFIIILILSVCTRLISFGPNIATGKLLQLVIREAVFSRTSQNSENIFGVHCYPFNILSSDQGLNPYQ